MFILLAFPSTVPLCDAVLLDQDHPGVSFNLLWLVSPFVVPRAGGALTVT